MNPSEFWATIEQLKRRFPARLDVLRGAEELHRHWAFKQMVLPAETRAFQNEDAHHLVAFVENHLKHGKHVTITAAGPRQLMANIYDAPTPSTATADSKAFPKILMELDRLRKSYKNADGVELLVSEDAFITPEKYLALAKRHGLEHVKSFNIEDLSLLTFVEELLKAGRMVVLIGWTETEKRLDIYAQPAAKAEEICPGCNARVKAGAAVCDSCGLTLDLVEDDAGNLIPPQLQGGAAEAIKDEDVKEGPLILKHSKEIVMDQSFITCRCGQTNLAGVRFCRKCGARMDDQASVAEEICPGCNARVKAGAAVCDSCGLTLDLVEDDAGNLIPPQLQGGAAEAIKDEDVKEGLPTLGYSRDNCVGLGYDVDRGGISAGPATGTLCCPACGKMNMVSARFCFKCGAQLAGSPSSAPDESCPACGTRVEQNAVICHSCGLTLDYVENEEGDLIPPQP